MRPVAGAEKLLLQKKSSSNFRGGFFSFKFNFNWKQSYLTGGADFFSVFQMKLRINGMDMGGLY